ncbi:MAG: ATP-binding protein [Acidimicrobiales bacterium]
MGSVLVKWVAPGIVDSGAAERIARDSLLIRQKQVGVAPEVETDQSGLWILRPYLPGTTLRDVLQGRQLSVDESLKLATSLLADLSAAHREGLVHRGVKPANVHFVADGRSSVLDLGMSRESIIVGSQPSGRQRNRFAAPEQSRADSSPVDSRADLYAVGAVLYEALTRRWTPPEPSPTPELRTIRRDVPRALSDLVSRLVRPDPDDRYQTAEGVLFDVDLIRQARLDGQPDPVLVVGCADRRIRLTDPAFVGRTAESKALEEVLVDTADGRGGVVTLEGESGGGKTRLLEEMADQARMEGAWILRGQGLDRTAQRPFQMLWATAAEIAERAGADIALATHLRQAMADQADTASSALPALATVLDGRPGASMPEQHGEIRSVRALARLFDALGRPGKPTLIILDDCQWADTVTGRAVAYWNQQAHPAGRWTTVILSYRTGELVLSSPMRADRSLTLAPLSNSDIEALAHSMAGPLPPEALAELNRLSGPSPLMAQAVLREMVDCGALCPGPDPGAGWVVAAGPMADISRAQHADELVVAGLRRLSSNAADLVAAGAVLGKEFELDLAQSLSGLSDAEAQDAMEEAHARRVLDAPHAPPGRARFLHDKLREAVLEGLTPAVRQALHGQAGDTLARTGTATSFDLAYHFHAAGRLSEALAPALAAADEARARHALGLAEVNFIIAAEAIEATLAADEESNALRVRVAEGLADVLALAGRYPEADQQLERASTLGSDPLARAAIAAKRGEVSFRRGDQANSARQLEDALRQLGRWVPRHAFAFWAGAVWELLVQTAHSLLPRLFIKTDPRALTPRDRLSLQVYSRLAYTYWFRSGRVRCAWSHLREMNMAERFGLSAELAQAYSEHAPVMTMIPWYRRGRSYAERSLAMRTELGDLWGQGQSLGFKGVVLYTASRYQECLESCQQAVQILARTGDQWETNTATWHIALAHYRLGEMNRAAEMATQLYGEATAIGDWSSAGIALSAWSRATGGDIPESLTATELNRRNEDVHTSTEVRLAEAIRLLADEKPDPAVRLLEEAWKAVNTAGLRQEYVAPVLPWLATALRELYEAVPADDPARRALMRRRRKVTRHAHRLASSYRNNLPHALRELSLVEADSGRFRSARRHLDQSITLAHQQEARAEEAQSLALAGDDRLGPPNGSVKLAERVWFKRARGGAPPG